MEALIVSYRVLSNWRSWPRCDWFHRYFSWAVVPICRQQRDSQCNCCLNMFTTFYKISVICTLFTSLWKMSRIRNSCGCRKDPFSPMHWQMITIVVLGRLCITKFRLGRCNVNIVCRIGFSFFLRSCFCVLLQMMDGTPINIDVTAPGAIIALGLMCLKVTLWQDDYIQNCDFMSYVPKVNRLQIVRTSKPYQNFLSFCIIVDGRLNHKQFYPGFVSHKHILICNMWGPTS